MNAIAEQIRKDGEAIDRLWRRVHETLVHRDRSRPDREAWTEACLELRIRYPDLFFPGGVQGWEAFLARDAKETECAITFLEVDPWFFRSGHLKEAIWRRLKRWPLTLPQEQRLERVALAYLERRTRRELWDMARYVRVRGTDSFWKTVLALAARPSGPATIKARWLLLVLENKPVQTWVRRELARSRHAGSSAPDLWFG